MNAIAEITEMKTHGTLLFNILRDVIHIEEQNERCRRT